MIQNHQELIHTLGEKKLTLSLAESMTAGLATYHLSSVKGTCNVLQGSIICYDPNVKEDILELDQELIKVHSAESQEVTDELARQLSKKIKADVHAAITGLANEGGSEGPDKPVGTVFFSVLWKDKLNQQRNHFVGSPSEIKEKACSALYQFIHETISQI